MTQLSGCSSPLLVAAPALIIAETRDQTGECRSSKQAVRHRVFHFHRKSREGPAKARPNRVRFAAIAADVGYGSLPAFNRAFKRVTE
jgi:AraC-like DNA-binding protein